MPMPARYRPLEPYLLGEPNEDDEVQMICPLHPDTKRSASLNVKTGAWYCFAGCGGGGVKELLGMRENWNPPPNGSEPRNDPRPQRKGSVAELPSEDQIAAWVTELQTSKTPLRRFRAARALSPGFIKKMEIGYSSVQKAYTIPVRDSDGQLLTVRFYNLDDREGKRKFWHVSGHAGPFIYPANLNQNGPVIILAEGELDALCTISAGWECETKTASAGTWKPAWTERYRDKIVYVAHDMDDAGQKANIKIGRALRKVAREVRVLLLPYPITEKHGADLTDFWRDRGGPRNKEAREEFAALLEAAELLDPTSKPPEQLDPSEATPSDAINAELHGKPLRLTLSVKGRGRATYVVPRRSTLVCDAGFGATCKVCPMMESMKSSVEIPRDDPLVLRMTGASTDEVLKVLKTKAGVPTKCPRVEVESEHQSVEVLFARPSVAHSNGVNGTKLNATDSALKITSVGRHDTPSNCTVQVIGAVQNNPKTQEAEFQAWEVNQVEALNTHFRMDPDTYDRLKIFRPAPGQSPLKKLYDIADDLARNVTKIYGRPEVHIGMDLVWHSALQFEFGGQVLDRGWLEMLVVGDTRTGKSYIAQNLMRHYRSGEYIDCEEATLPGIIGGVQQIRNEWMVTWGIIPVNDRRLTVLDEISGISTDDIGRMSGVRASGIASIDKVVSERTMARTRKIWIGNPRDDLVMDDYAFGIYAIKPLIGRSEDIARFDYATTVNAGDVNVDRHIMREKDVDDPPRYTQEDCSALVRWAWTREPGDIVWEEGAQDECLRASMRLGKEYVREPPLILRQDIRIKVARIAVAIACRLFSTENGEEVLVRRSHVRAASRYLDTLYSDDRFGYRYLSTRARRNSALANASKKKAERLIKNRQGLGAFLLTRPEGKFFARDLEEVTGMDREGAVACINTLMQLSLVEKERGFIKIVPELSELLREMHV